ncbi:MAG: tetratricopeptide repeat protein [Rhizomicrobium sp.]
MAQFAPAPSIGPLTAMDAKAETLAKWEAFADETDEGETRRQSNVFVRQAVEAYGRGDTAQAAKYALAATKADESNARAFHILAMALEKMGHRYKALVTYERAFQLDPNDPSLALDLGLTAWNQNMKEGAERMFRLYIQACPDSPLGYNNLGSALGDMGKTSMAIDTLRSAIERMPTVPMLWNSLATVLAGDGRADESIVFYREAIRLNPVMSKTYHNLGYAYSHLGMMAEALDAFDNALVHVTDQDDRIEANHSRSICLIGMGRLEEGFREYEIRNDARFRDYVHHITKAPLWRGEPLEGKRILVVGEQGLGDELMFANVLPDIAHAVGAEGKLEIAVDPRLIALFQRSFPHAAVGRYEDRTLLDKEGNRHLRFIPFAVEKGEPDFYAPMGTLLPAFRKRVEDFPHEAFLKPDGARVKQFREVLRADGAGPAVGICWRSMMLGPKRAKYYSSLEMWGPILKTPGVRFVNLQYGDCADELARARDLFGIDIKTIDGLDLTNDVDGAAALCAALDLVISAPTAAAATAGSVGTEVWFPTAGRTWPQLGTDEYPWYRKSHVFSPTKFADWNELMPRIGECLAAFASR